MIYTLIDGVSIYHLMTIRKCLYISYWAILYKYDDAYNSCLQIAGCPA